MDFASFLTWSQGVLRARPEVRPLCETRIARAFAAIRPEVSEGEAPPKVHRCHLAEAWCALRGLPDAHPRALVCEGVRHALAILFRELAARGEAVLVPSDVYPVYWQLAAAAGVRAEGAETFPNFDLKAIFVSCARQGISHVLLPYPLKLHGRSWSPEEHAAAAAWLAGDGARRLILDGVYSFGLPLGEPLKSLLATDQVFYLDSLFKGWLHERVFGAAVVPARDFEKYVAAFRREGPPQEKLLAAHALLSAHAGFPARLAREIRARREALKVQLKVNGEEGYLTAVEGNAHTLLETRGILTIPLSVFGGQNDEWSIASALPAAGAR